MLHQSPDEESVGAVSGAHPGPAVQQTTIAEHGHGGSLQANNGGGVAPQRLFRFHQRDSGGAEVQV